MKFPSEIYAIEVEVKGEKWFEFYETFDGIEDKDKVGIYELKETKKMFVKRELK